MWYILYIFNKQVIVIKPLCFIIGAAPTDKIYIDKQQHFIIAADGGLEILKANNIIPDLIVGDFDSLGFIPEGDNVITHKPEKDYTDTFLALNEGIERGYDTFILYGCTGGRLDHTLANIQTSAYAADKNVSCYMINENQIITAVKNSTISFDDTEKGYISVFCNGKAAKGVTIKGLKYTLDNVTLSSVFPLGVSNEFTGQVSEISVKDGTLIVIWETDIENFINSHSKPKK